MKIWILCIGIVLATAVTALSEEPEQGPGAIEVSLEQKTEMPPAPAAPGTAEGVPAPPAEEANVPSDSGETGAVPPDAPTAGPDLAPAAEPLSSEGLAGIREKIAAGDLEGAKSQIEGALPGLQGAMRDEVMDLLAGVNYKMLVEGKGAFPGVSEHVVKSGDSLYVIAKKYKTTPDMILQVNRLKGTTIYPGEKLRIVSGPFSIRVSRSKNRLELYLNDQALKTYRVSTGTANSTPTGDFTITTKLENPTWFKTGAVVPPGKKENILGTRWLGFNKTGYGIHGTTQPELIGTQATAGCIRMKNDEVEELYALVPSGTVVTVTD